MKNYIAFTAFILLPWLGGIYLLWEDSELEIAWHVLLGYQLSAFAGGFATHWVFFSEGGAE